MLIIVRNIVIGLMLFVWALPCKADPSPFGLELGKASIKDIEAKYKISSQKKTSFGTLVTVQPKPLGLEGLTAAEFSCDDNGIIEAIFLKMKRERFDAMYNMLSEKYKSTTKNIPFVGNKMVEFEDGDSVISLISEHLSFEIDIEYITKKLLNRINKVREEKQKEKDNKEKALL